MQLTYTGDSAVSVEFHFVVEQLGKEMALFDGIVRKIIDQGNQVTKEKSKNFYYEVGSLYQSIRIFATSNDNVGYYLAAKFVESSDFMSSQDDSIYPPFKQIDAGRV